MRNRYDEKVIVICEPLSDQGGSKGRIFEKKVAEAGRRGYEVHGSPYFFYDVETKVITAAVLMQKPKVSLKRK